MWVDFGYVGDAVADEGFDCSAESAVAGTEFEDGYGVVLHGRGPKGWGSLGPRVGLVTGELGCHIGGLVDLPDLYFEVGAVAVTESLDDVAGLFLGVG